MEIDAAKCLRLKASIDATLASITGSSFGAPALVEAYADLREEVELSITDAATKEEFDRLFPYQVQNYQRFDPSSYDPLAMEVAGTNARSLLARLTGWLDGYVQNARLEHEARAYAEARVRLERPAT